MPSLAETLQQNKKVTTRGPNGELLESTPEDVQTLSQKAGLQAPPLTPMGQAAIGANAKQQDMAGSPNQKQAALNLSQNPNENLADVMRRQQVRTEATATEQQGIQKSKDMQDLGQVGDRVTDFINAQRQKLATNTQAVGTEAAATGTNAAGQEQALTDLKPVLTQLMSDPTNMHLQMQVNQALGYDASKQLSPAEINNLYKTSVDSISKGGADLVDNKLTAQDLMNQGLNYTSAQLSTLLGVPEDQVANLTVGQIRAQVQQQIANEFNKSQQLQQKATSGELGVAERGLAHQAGMEASATGVRASEADVAKLDQQIKNAETVTFNGQQMPIETMLSDENISKTITDYLNAAPGSPQRAQLDKTEPELSKFITNNQALLKDAADKLSAGAGQFQELQKTNKDVASLGGQLPDDLVNKLVPGAGQLADQKLDPNSVPVLAAAQGLDDTHKRQYTQDLQEVTNQFPQATDELKSLSADQVKALELDKSGGKWQDYTQQMSRYQDIANTPDDHIMDLVSKMYDTGKNVDYNAALKQESANRVLGLAHEDPALKAIDANGDGIVDSPAEIRSRLVKGQPSLVGTLAGDKPVADPQKYTPPEVPQPWNKQKMADTELEGDTDSIKSALQQNLSKFVVNGKLDTAGLANSYTVNDKSKPADVQSNIQELKYLQSHGTLDPAAQKSLAQMLDTNRTALDKKSQGAVFDDIDTYNVTGSFHQNADLWQSKLDQLNKSIGPDDSVVSHDTRVLRDTIQKAIELDANGSAADKRAGGPLDKLRSALSDRLTDALKARLGAKEYNRKFTR
jgi:hypothetical protein